MSDVKLLDISEESTFFTGCQIVAGAGLTEQVTVWSGGAEKS